MSKFFDDEEEIDYGVAQNTADNSPHAPKIQKPANGGTSQQAYLNDYRNRMPFHYIEEGGDGYYYWQYGATMEIVFTITDEVALTDPAPLFVGDVRVNGKSVLDRSLGVANIALGTLARESKKNYYTKEQVDLLMASMMEVVDFVQQAQIDNKNYIDEVSARTEGLVSAALAEIKELRNDVIARVDTLVELFEKYRDEVDHRLQVIEEFIGEITIYNFGSPSRYGSDIYFAGTPSEVGEDIYSGGDAQTYSY